jgi:hypothetical protein
MPGKYVADHPAPPNKPGVNWVEKVGGLPGPIDAIMRALMAKGWAQSRAVATGVNHVKKVCATGRAFGGKTPVSAAARAAACGAAARWEAMKASAKVNSSIPEDKRRAIDLAFAYIDQMAVDMALGRETQSIIDFARRPGLVQAQIQVKSKKGTTFTRNIWVRPKQAKALKQQKGKPTLSQQGVKVTAERTAVLSELAKVPKEQRPKGWQDAVKALVTTQHGGRLGPQGRKALHDFGKSIQDKNSPLRKAVYTALAADAPKKRKQKITPIRSGKGKAMTRAQLVNAGNAQAARKRKASATTKSGAGAV